MGVIVHVPSRSIHMSSLHACIYERGMCTGSCGWGMGEHKKVAYVAHRGTFTRSLLPESMVIVTRVRNYKDRG